jgi:hypothetical protein
MLLPINIPAGPVQIAFQTCSLLRRQAIAAVTQSGLELPEFHLFPFKPQSFRGGQVAGPYALSDPFLLPMFTLVYPTGLAGLSLRTHGKPGNKDGCSNR